MTDSVINCSLTLFVFNVMLLLVEYFFYFNSGYLVYSSYLIYDTLSCVTLLKIK